MGDLSFSGVFFPNCLLNFTLRFWDGIQGSQSKENQVLTPAKLADSKFRRELQLSIVYNGLYLNF